MDHPLGQIAAGWDFGFDDLLETLPWKKLA
jgi:hypothetical protein